MARQQRPGCLLVGLQDREQVPDVAFDPAGVGEHLGCAGARLPQPRLDLGCSLFFLGELGGERFGKADLGERRGDVLDPPLGVRQLLLDRLVLAVCSPACFGAASAAAARSRTEAQPKLAHLRCKSPI